VFPRASASGTHGRRGTARQAPTASQVRSSVPRFAPCIGHSGAAMRWSQHLCERERRWRAISVRDRTRTGDPLTSRVRTPQTVRQIGVASASCLAAHARPSQTTDQRSLATCRAASHVLMCRRPSGRASLQPRRSPNTHCCRADTTRQQLYTDVPVLHGLCVRGFSRRSIRPVIEDHYAVAPT
jgi:hypothetical protein